MKRLNPVTVTMILTLLWLLSSCDKQQDICFDHDAAGRRAIDVVFDWTECPEARPATMSLYLFPADGSHYTRHEFTNRAGGKILIAPGVYTAIAMNSDNESVRVSNTGQAREFSIVLRDNATTQGASVLKKNERVCPAPDSLWVSCLREVNIGEPKLTVPMSDACFHYSIEIKHLENSKLVRSIDATLGGMNGMVRFHGSPDADAKLHFTMDVKEGRASGSFLTLGHCGVSRSGGEAEEPLHSLGFYFTLGDGSVRYCTSDVTDLIHGQTLEDCHIVIDSLSVPETSSGNMSFTVRDWNVVNIYIDAN
ncbi:MAG: DUF5119 domain-containing protein [Muribaculaceae bacterium]|nr:DUF5119 domain-containing protein [Muribaculaceae bacterium]